MQAKTELETAKVRVIRFLGYRARSRKEIRAYLRRKGYGEQIISETCAFLEELDLLDDQDFALQRIRYCYERGYGIIRVRQELKSKGIFGEQLDRLLEQEYSSERVDALVRMLIKKRSRLPEKDERKKKQKLYAYLKGRGFLHDEIFRVMETEDSP